MTQEFRPARGGGYSTRSKAEKFIPPEYDVVEGDGVFYGVLRVSSPLPVETARARQSLDIICPQCGACHFETTNQYSSELHAHPGMLRLKEPFASYGWQPMPPDPSAGSGSIECADCGGLLAPEGKFKVRQ